jgi:integrase
LKQLVRDIQKAASKYSSASHPGYRTATKCQNFVRNVFTWACEEERIKKNPATFKRIYDDFPDQRTEKLNPERFGVIWNLLSKLVAEDARTALAIQVATLTLQRPLHVARAEWPEFNFDTPKWIVPKEKTKTKKHPYIIPLNQLVSERVMLAEKWKTNNWTFPSPVLETHVRRTAMSQTFNRLVKRGVKLGLLDTEDIQLYDVRRFGRTHLEHTLGVSPEIAELVISHARDRSMERRYDVRDRWPELVRAHDLWGEEVRRMASAARNA